jgi:alpha-glucuronidase
LHSGKIVIQSLYDSHYEGAEAAANYVREWQKLQGLIDEQRYQEVLAQLEYQAGQAEVWRDAVVNWFLKTSGIPDEKGRAGKHPGRVEAESMQLEGYTPVPVNPWEAASGGMAVSCPISKCTARFVFEGSAGRHEVRIRYFDQNNGAARFRILLNGQLLDQWVASDRLPTQKIDGTSSSLRIVTAVALKSGDEIRIEGSPDGGESAALDYVEIQ